MEEKTCQSFGMVLCIDKLEALQMELCTLTSNTSSFRGGHYEYPGTFLIGKKLII
jgi:hypothetical protein